jgi:transposase
VIAVARKAQIVRDFGISEACLARWLNIADREDGRPVAGAAADDPDVRELRRRVNCLEQENEILRRATATSPVTSTHNDVPAGP